MFDDERCVSKVIGEAGQVIVNVCDEGGIW